MFLAPVVIVNVRGYYAPLIALLEAAIDERFIAPQYRDMWTVVAGPDEVLAALARAPRWSESALSFAAL